MTTPPAPLPRTTPSRPTAAYGAPSLGAADRIGSAR